MKKIFLTGASSGIGLACYSLLCKSYEVVAPTRAEFDLSNFEMISNFDFSSYDIIINCAAANVGTCFGFHQNSYQNQLEQIHVNYFAPLLMAKKYTQDRKTGHFVYITSSGIDSPELYNIVYTTSKLSLKHSINALGKKYSNFLFTEIAPGKTKTNMLHQNYNGSKTYDEIELEYNQSPYLTADSVAQHVLYSIENKITELKIIHDTNKKSHC